MNYIYAIRNKETGKLMSGLVSPRRKYWDRRGNAENALEHAWKSTKVIAEVVKFELVEVPIDNDNT